MFQVVKGISGRVGVVRPGSSKVFEEVVFIVRDGGGLVGAVWAVMAVL